MLAATPLLMLEACELGESDVTRGETVTTDSTVPALTPGSTMVPGGTSAVTLGGDDRPRTPPLDVTSEFAEVAPAASIDALAERIVATIERWLPAGEGNQPITESAAAPSGTSGTVTVRRHGLADDSVAGYEYRVTVDGTTGQWTITSATRSAICRRGVTDGLCT